MSETFVSNDRGVLRLTLEIHCEGCNGPRTFDAEYVSLTLIHGIVTYVNFSCIVCQQHIWWPADNLRRELEEAGLIAQELTAGRPELLRGVWLVPTDRTLPPELITDSESDFLDSRF